jgi:hypothetical protein
VGKGDGVIGGDSGRDLTVLARPARVFFGRVFFSPLPTIISAIKNK